MKIIRHADDLGITLHSAQQLLDSWQRGDLDGFSILTNGDAIEFVAAELEKKLQLPARIALHFNLTEGNPAALAESIPLLVNAQGQLKHSFFSLLMLYVFSTTKKKQQLKHEIAIECRAQIALLGKICGQRSIAAIDSHTHIHMIPNIFDIVSQTAKETGILAIRISSEPFYLDNSRKDWKRLFWWINLSKHLLLKILARQARQKIRSLGLNAPDALIGVLYSGKMSAEVALAGIKAAVAGKASEIELLFHIGRAVNGEKKRWTRNREAKFHLSEWRDIERAELHSLTNILQQFSANFKSPNP